MKIEIKFKKPKDVIRENWWVFAVYILGALLAVIIKVIV